MTHPTATISTLNGRVNRLRNPNSTTNTQFKKGEAVYDRLSRKIVFVQSTSLDLDGNIDCLELIGQDSRTFYRSAFSVRSLSYVEKAMIFLEDNLLGSSLEEIPKNYKRIIILILIIIGAYVDPIELIKTLLD